jgi:hypothetical protein
MTWSYGSLFRIDFSYTDRLRHNSAQFGSFSKFSIFHKFAFVFVSGFTAFAFVLVFKCKSIKRFSAVHTPMISSTSMDCRMWACSVGCFVFSWIGLLDRKAAIPRTVAGESPMFVVGN